MNLTLTWLFLLPLFVLDRLERVVQGWTRFSTSSSTISIAADLTRRKVELIVENALLRQQLMVLRRQVKRPRLTQADRIWLVTLTR